MKQNDTEKSVAKKTGRGGEKKWAHRQKKKKKEVSRKEPGNVDSNDLLPDNSPGEKLNLLKKVREAT